MIPARHPVGSSRRPVSGLPASRPSGLPAFRPPGLPSPEEISFTEYIVPACLSVEEEEKESTLSWEWGGLLTEEDPVPRVNFWPTHT